MWEITTAYEREAQRIQHNFQAMVRTAEQLRGQTAVYKSSVKTFMDLIK